MNYSSILHLSRRPRILCWHSTTQTTVLRQKQLLCCARSTETSKPQTPLAFSSYQTQISTKRDLKPPDVASRNSTDSRVMEARLLISDTVSPEYCTVFVPVNRDMERTQTSAELTPFNRQRPAEYARACFQKTSINWVSIVYYARRQQNIT